MIYLLILLLPLTEPETREFIKNRDLFLTILEAWKLVAWLPGVCLVEGLLHDDLVRHHHISVSVLRDQVSSLFL